MNASNKKLLCFGALAFLFACFGNTQAQDEPRTPPAAQDMPVEKVEAPDVGSEAQENAGADTDLAVEAADEGDRRSRRDRRSQAIVSIGHDSHLRAGEAAEVVVSVFGSSTSEGDVRDAVVSVLGNSRVTGSVGDSVVAVVGDVYVNSRVRGDVVSVLGKVELGPEAEIGGEVVSVLGSGVQRDPAAIVRGGLHEVVGGFDWLRPWVEHCLVYARPLALEPGLGWAWTLALGFLAMYALMALMFREGVDQCAETFDAHPGHSLLTALLSVVLTPVVIVVLSITVVGIVVLPFLMLAMFVATLFGKAVMLAWIGRRCIRSYGHTAIAVLVGGIVVLALYLVPVVGFLAFNLLGFIGFGIVAYTMILSAKNTRREKLAAAGGAAIPASPEVPAGASEQPATDQNTPAAAPVAGAASAALPRAGFWIRMAALLIDAILVGVVVGTLSEESRLFLPLLATYGALMWKFRGTTVGGIVCNLQVTRLDGREMDWPTSVVRALSCFLSLVVAGLGFIWMVFDDERQTWHDKIAGTVVVRVPRGVPLL